LAHGCRSVDYELGRSLSEEPVEEDRFALAKRDFAYARYDSRLAVSLTDRMGLFGRSISVNNDCASHSPVLSLAEEDAWRQFQREFQPRSSDDAVNRGLTSVAAFALTFLSLQKGTLSVTLVLLYTNPFWALLSSALFLNEPLSLARVACIAVAMTGIVVLIGPLGGDINFVNFYGIKDTLPGCI
jgi:hypothetical protein